ncbi:Uncharacterised protein [Legionella oakridgensis]|nr:Uncharacterised protein [Legionella oakridgensis]
MKNQLKELPIEIRNLEMIGIIECSDNELDSVPPLRI